MIAFLLILRRSYGDDLEADISIPGSDNKRWPLLRRYYHERTTLTTLAVIVLNEENGLWRLCVETRARVNAASHMLFSGEFLWLGT